MARTSPRQIDYQRMIRALKKEGVPVDKIAEAVIVRILGPLNAGTHSASDAPDLDDELAEWQRTRAHG